MNVLGFLVFLAAFCGVFLLLSYRTLRWSRTISVTGQRAVGETRFQNGALWFLICFPYVVVVPAVVSAFGGDMTVWWWPVVMIGMIAVVLFTLARMGQGGGRIVDRTEYEPPIGDHTPDLAWKWGLVYFNPDDPALIVEKRFGLGHTVNLGNRWSFVLLAVILLPIALLIALDLR